MGWRWWAGFSLVSLLVLVELSQIEFWSLFGKSLTATEIILKSNSSSSSVATTQLPIFATPTRRKGSRSSSKDATFPKNSPASQSEIRPFRLCTREEIQLGEWVPVTLPRIPYSPYNRWLSCNRQKEPWQTWDWQPFDVKDRKCILLPWDTTHFCSLARFATVAIVGDSLSWEQFASLIGLLDVRVKLRRGNSTNIYHVCKGQVRLVYLRSEDLKLVDHLINETSPNVLIINRGAHFVPNNILEPELVNLTTDLLDWQRSCEVSQRPCHLLVRTTVPGHPHCWNFTRPAKTIREMEEHIADMSKYNVSNHYPNWCEFKRQNQLSLRVYEKANLSFDVLDGYHINILRPDEHLIRNNDCMHSCHPGKMDVYNQLLLHFLQRRGGVAMENASWINPAN